MQNPQNLRSREEDAMPSDLTPIMMLTLQHQCCKD